MNQQEAKEMVAHAKQMWGNNFKVTEQTIMDWAQHSGDIPANKIKQALEAFGREGREFCPPPTTLMARARGFLGPALYNNSETRRAICMYCGGPTPSGRNHMAWCQHGECPMTIHPDDRIFQMGLPDNAHHHNPWKEAVPPPAGVRAMLKGGQVGKRM